MTTLGFPITKHRTMLYYITQTQLKNFGSNFESIGFCSYIGNILNLFFEKRFFSKLSDKAHLGYIFKGAPRFQHVNQSIAFCLTEPLFQALPHNQIQINVQTSE